MRQPISTYACLLGVFVMACAAGSAENRRESANDEPNGTTSGGASNTNGQTGGTAPFGGADATGGLGADAGTGASGSSGAGAEPTACTPPASSTLLAPIVPIKVGTTAPLSVAPLKPRPFFATAGGAGPADALLSTFNEQQWRAIVPVQSPRDSGVRCPANGSTAFTWNPSNPNQVTCGGQTYAYGSATGTAEQVQVLSGKTVSIPVWNIAGGGTSKLGMLIDRRKADYLNDQLERLAKAYVGTGNDKYARRIAITFDEWAKYLPDYVLTSINTTNLVAPSQMDPAAGPWGRYERLSSHNGLGNELTDSWVLAMDAIYGADSMWNALRSEFGYDVRERILDKLIMNELDYLLNLVDFRAHTTTNLSGSYTQTARWATLLGRPDIIEWLNAYMQGTVRNWMRDGMHAESIGYSRNYIYENGKITAEMANFFEIWPTSPSLEPIQARLSVYDAAVRKGKSAIEAIELPDGSIAPFGNTPLYTSAAHTTTVSRILPAYGHITLGDGSGAEQFQINLGFQDSGNHTEQDVLSFTLHDATTELLGDIRDSRMTGRAFTESTLAHNTVTVNRSTQPQRNNQSNENIDHLFTNGDVLFFEPNLAGISAAEVNATRAYQKNGLAQRYQRLMILNATDPKRPYIVDLFRVKGGTMHDYFLHGSTRWDSVNPASASGLSLSAMSGTYPLLEAGETWGEATRTAFYGAFRNVRRADSPGAWNVTFQELGGQRGSRIFMVDDGSIDVFLSQSPSPFRDKSPDPADAATFYSYWRPTLMARHHDTAGADTLFAAVIEPLNGASSLAKVEKLTPNTDLERIALRIEFTDGRYDVVLAALTDPATGKPASLDVTASNGGKKFSLTGHVGIWSSVSGSRKQLIGGTAFVHPDGALALETASYAGAIIDATRVAYGCGVNSLLTDAALPEGDVLKGRFVRATFGAYDVKPSSAGGAPWGIKQQTGFTQLYRIERVVIRDGKTYIVLDDDPGLLFEDGVAFETLRPYRAFKGPVTFEILLSATQ